MSNNPKIRVEADLSSFQQELSKLEQTISELGSKLQTSSGKADFNFNGSQAELNALVKQADRLTAALDKGNKSSSQYAKNLKLAQEAMAAAAKLSSKLEDAGTSRSSQVSGYFRNYSNELGSDHAGAVHDAEMARNREQREALAASAARDQRAMWASRAAKFAGFIGGSVLGGGGTYGNIGSYLGSRLPGPLGMVGGAIGGSVGRIVDQSIDPARAEARSYSELRRMVGSTTTDFDKLRDSVRSVVHGLNVTDNEAVSLAKQFAHTASLSGDATDYIARSVGTSSGFAQGYGMSSENAAAFFANMRITGVANNDKDNRRLAMLIGESVQRGGTSAKMDEVLSAISGFASRSAMQSMTTPNVGQFSSYLSTLTGSSYAGIKGDPNNAAQLMGMMDDAVRNGGTMGEASQYHWLRARQEAFPGMSAMHNSLMQTGGVFGDLSALFSPGSPGYDTANAAARAEMDKTNAAIKTSGLRNNFQVARAHIKKISGGNSYLDNANFRGMLGGNYQQASALMLADQNDPGLGKLEQQISGYGIDTKKLNMSQVSAMAQMMIGGTPAMIKQYEKLLGSGKMSKADMDRADGIMGRDGYGESFKKLLIQLTEKYDSDEGFNSQLSQIELTRKMQESVSGLVGIETDMREYLLRILDTLTIGRNPVAERMVAGFKAGLPASGKNLRGGSSIGGMATHEVDRNLKEMGMTGTQEERDSLYIDFMRKAQSHPDYYPMETEAWMKKARGGHAPVSPAAAILGDDKSKMTVSSVVPASPALIDRKIRAAAARHGVPPAIALALAKQESGMGQNLVGRLITSGMHKGDRAHGVYQYMAKSSVGWDRDDIDQNIEHGVSDLAERYRKFGSWELAVGAHHAGPHSIKNGRLPNTTDGNKTTRAFANDIMAMSDQMPDTERKRQANGGNSMQFRNTIDVNLWDSKGNRAADPVTVSTNYNNGGAPVPAGRR